VTLSLDMSGPRFAAASLAALMMAACGDSTALVVLGPDPEVTPNNDAGDGGIAIVDGSLVFPDGKVVEGFCQGTGPLVKLPQGSCTGDVGKRTFLFAACSCQNTTVSGALHTDSVNSSGASTTGKTAAMGANGSFQSNGHIDVGGSIWAASGTPAVALKDHGSIATELRAGGIISIDGAFIVGGDVYAAGGVDVKSGSLTCGGKLHAASGTVTAGVTATGGIVHDSFTIVPPCECAKLLDVPGIVQAFAGANDDTVLGIAPSALSSPGPHDVTLACGRYYFDTMAGDVTVHLLGRTAVFIGGDVTVGSLKLDLSSDAEVDIFVAKNVHLDGTLSSNAPAARVRVYIGGDSVTVTGFVGMRGNVYAPNAVMLMASSFQMTGSILAKQLQFSGDFTIHYDEAILDTPGCDPPGRACDTCHDCSGSTPACKGGTCVPCVVTEDCCAPLVCRSGSCIPNIF
jgi:hypothetical protein